MAVHHVNMDVIGPRGVDAADLLAQFGEVGGQNGWCNSNVLLHGAQSVPAMGGTGKDTLNLWAATQARRKKSIHATMVRQMTGKGAQIPRGGHQFRQSPDFVRAYGFTGKFRVGA